MKLVATLSVVLAAFWAVVPGEPALVRDASLAPSATTDRAAAIGNAVFGALHGILLPRFITVEHQLVAVGDRLRRTFARALYTFTAKVLQAEIDGAVSG